MSLVFDRAIACSEKIIEKLARHGYLNSLTIDDNKGVKDLVYISGRYHRAHVSIVDARETKKLWLLHFTIFPNINDPSPIYGFDIVAGPSRVSGAFHDFSCAGEGNHAMMQWFSSKTQNIEWNKKRPLPEWAQKIFSPAMVAIGAVGPDELEKFAELGLETLDYYLETVGEIGEQDYAETQNTYCFYQRQNPHTPRVLVSLGFTEKEAQEFVENNLFPLIG